MTEKKNAKIYFRLLLLAFILCAAFWLDINGGYRRIQLDELWEIFLGGGEKGLRYTLIHLRLPRVLISLLVGVGLAVSGCVMQGVSGNDMAEPGILGIHGGGGLFLAVFFVFFKGNGGNFSFLLPVIAFCGCACIAALDYSFARTEEGMSPRRFLLVGIAVATAVSSITSMLMLRMSDSDYAFVQNWLSGNIWGAGWENVGMLFVGLLVLAGFCFYKSRTLNVLALGRQNALGLGVPVARQNLLFLAAAMGISGLCCAVGGGLSFVGLVCPHLAKRITGPNFRYLLPGSMLTGGILMLLSDLISRTLLSPKEISIGIVAAVIGAPYFVYLIIRGTPR